MMLDERNRVGYLRLHSNVGQNDRNRGTATDEANP